MLKTKDILDEKNKILHKVSEEVVFPLTKKDKNLIKDMIKYLKHSQIEEMAEKENLRPGMGLAAVQMGILKRYFVVVFESDEGKFNEYTVINPKIVSHSEELIYAELGEGCLSVNRETEGIIPRYARITIEAEDIHGNNITIRAREEISIAFQHEIDHLNGIMFTDKINKKNPFKNSEKMRAI